MSTETRPDGTLFAISCRKADPTLAEAAHAGRAPLEILTVPKRAGTYMLLRGPLRENVQEQDLVRDPERDSDTGDGHLRAENAHRDWSGQQRSVEDSIARTLLDLGPLVLYVHGFNTEPGEALRAGVKLQEILDTHQIGATVVVFMWPSAGHLLDYFPDQKAAGRFGWYALVNFLLSLQRNARPGAPVHCVAHSMGTYVVTRALGTITTLHLESRPVLSEVAYMQPDIDYDILCSGYSGPAFDSPSYLEIPDGYGATTMVERLTIYCTTNDVALFASLFKNRTKRLGAYGPGLEDERDHAVVMNTRIRPNVHVVNCDEGCVFDAAPQHSHSHFLSCPQMQTDLAAVLAGGNGSPYRTSMRVPRWDRLGYAPPLPVPGVALLTAMAGFWGWVGNVALNRIVVRLVKIKKWLQRLWKVATGVIPVAIALATAGTGVVARQHPWWLAASALSGTALLLYLVAWVLARRVQQREDA